MSFGCCCNQHNCQLQAHTHTERELPRYSKCSGLCAHTHTHTLHRAIPLGFFTIPCHQRFISFRFFRILALLFIHLPSLPPPRPLRPFRLSRAHNSSLSDRALTKYLFPMIKVTLSGDRKPKVLVAPTCRGRAPPALPTRIHIDRVGKALVLVLGTHVLGRLSLPHPTTLRPPQRGRAKTKKKAEHVMERKLKAPTLHHNQAEYFVRPRKGAVLLKKERKREREKEKIANKEKRKILLLLLLLLFFSHSTHFLFVSIFRALFSFCPGEEKSLRTQYMHTAWQSNANAARLRLEERNFFFSFPFLVFSCPHLCPQHSPSFFLSFFLS